MTNYVGDPAPKWYVTADYNPVFYVTYTGWPLRCSIPVLPGGDGAESAGSG